MSAQLLRFGERLAREGFRVIAPDFFSRSHGVDPNDFGAVIGSITPDNLKGDFAAAADALRGRRGHLDRRHRVLHGRLVHVPRRQVGRRPRRRRRRCRSTAAASPASSASVQCPTLMFFGDQRPVHPDGRHRERCRPTTATPSSCTRAPTTASCATAPRATTPTSAADAWSRMLGVLRRAPPLAAVAGAGQVRPSATITRISANGTEQVEARRDDRDPVVVGIEPEAVRGDRAVEARRAPRRWSRSGPRASTPRSSRGCPGSRSPTTNAAMSAETPSRKNTGIAYR